MIIFLYGEDSYRARVKLKEIVENYKQANKNGLSLKFFTFGDDTISAFDLKSEISQTSMFKEKKLLVLTGFFSDKKFKEDFLKEGKTFIDSDDIIVFYNDSKIAKTDVLFKFLKENAKCQEFGLLSGLKLKNWAKGEIERYKAAIEPTALDALLEYAGEDLWRLANEIQKLISFRKNKTIRIDDVKTLVKPKIDTNIFKTIDAIAQRDKKTAIKLLQQHLEKGESPLYLLSMIAYQLRNILLVKDLMENHQSYSMILKNLELHPFVIKKSYFQAQKFTMPELKKIYQRVFQTDFQIKTGRIEPNVGLEVLVAGI